MDKKITSMEGEADEGLDAGCTKKREAETAVGLFEGAAQSLGHEATRPAKARKTMQRQTQPDDPAPRHADTCSRKDHKPGHWCWLAAENEFLKDLILSKNNGEEIKYSQMAQSFMVTTADSRRFCRHYGCQIIKKVMGHE